MPGAGTARASTLPATASDQAAASGDGGVRWLMSSDVCKHCTHAACLDVCPTGALFRTEFGTVVVQDDICNGCGYCVPACPYGVIDQRKDDGRAFKCTLCYDRLKRRARRRPARRPARPSRSSSATLDELRERADAAARGAARRRASTTPGSTAHDPDDGVGGDGAFFLLLDEPEVYGLPPDPVVTTRDLRSMWKHVGAAAVALAGLGVASFAGEAAMSPARRPRRPRWCPEAEFASYYGRPIIKTPDVEDARRPAVPLPRRPGRRVGACSPRAPRSPAGPALERVARLAPRRRARRPAPSPWSTTSAGPSGS